MMSGGADHRSVGFNAASKRNDVMSDERADKIGI
jgi:hypothetical protein